MGYSIPHHIEYNLQTGHFEVSNNVRDVTFISGSLAVVATNYGIEAFPQNQYENYGYITISGGFDRIEHAYNNVYAYSSTLGTVYRTTVEDLKNANGSASSLQEVYPIRNINNWGDTTSEYVKFNYSGTNTITISGGGCVITDSSPSADKAFVSYSRQLKLPFSIKNRVKITNIDYNSSVIDGLLSISHSVAGISTITQGILRASFYNFVDGASSARIGLYYSDGINNWYWHDTNSEWHPSNYTVPFSYNVYNTFYTVELVVTSDGKVVFNIYNDTETLIESVSTTDDHASSTNNLVSNSTFDSDTSGWLAENGASLDSVTDPKGVGTDCLRITSSGIDNPKATQNVWLMAGRSYTISFKQLRGTEATIQVYVEVGSKNYGFITMEATTNWGTTTTNFVSNTTGYGKLSLVQISSSSFGETSYFDDVELTSGGDEKIPLSSVLWGWFGDNRSSGWITGTAYCTYYSDYFNVYPYWVAYEPIVNDLDLVNIGSDTYLGIACDDGRAGETGRVIIIKNEDESSFEELADCQTVAENSYAPRFIRFAEEDVYYQLGLGSNSYLYGIVNFWSDNDLMINRDLIFSSETGLVFNSTINDLAVYLNTSYDGEGDSLFVATDDGACVIYQHRTDRFKRNYFSLGHENIIMQDSFISYDVGSAPDCWTSTVNDSDNQSIRVLYDTGDYYYGAGEFIGGITQIDKSTLDKVRDVVPNPTNLGCQSIAVDDQFVWNSYESDTTPKYHGVVRHLKDSSDYDIVRVTEWGDSANLNIEGTMGVDLTHVYVSVTNSMYANYDYPILAKVDRFSLDYEFFQLTGSGIPSSAGQGHATSHHIYGVAVDSDYVYILDFCSIGAWNAGPHLIRWNKSTERVDKVLPNLGDVGVVYTDVARYIYLDDDYLYFSWAYNKAGPIRRINKNMESSTYEDGGGGDSSSDICVGEDVVYGVPKGSFEFSDTRYIRANFVYKDDWDTSDYNLYRIIEWTLTPFELEDANFRIVSMDANSLYASRFPYAGKQPFNLRVDYNFVTTVDAGVPPYTDAIYNTPSLHYTLITIGDMTGYDFSRTFGSASKNKVLEMSDLSDTTNISISRHFKDIAVNNNYVIKFKSKLKRVSPFYMDLKYNGNTALKFKWDSDGYIYKYEGSSWESFSIASGSYSKSSWSEYKIEAFVNSNSFNFYIDDVKYESTVSGAFSNNVDSLNEISFYTDSGYTQLAYIDGVTIYDYNEVAEDYSIAIDYPVFHGITNKSKSVTRTISYNRGGAEVMVYNYDPVFGGSISQVNLNMASDGVCLYAYYSTAAPMGPEQVDINKMGVFNRSEVLNASSPDNVWVCGDFGLNTFNKWDSIFHIESIHVNDISYNYNNKIVTCATKGGLDILNLGYAGLGTRSYVSLPNGCSSVYNSDSGIYFNSSCHGVLFLSESDYSSYTEGEELYFLAEEKFNYAERNLSNNSVNCIHATNDGLSLLVSTESGVDFITYNVDSSYVPTDYAWYSLHLPQGSDKCFISPKGDRYYSIRGEGLAVNYASPLPSGTLYDDIEGQVTTGGDQDLTIGRGVHIKWRNNIWNDYQKGQKIYIEHTGLIHKIEAYVKRVGNPDPLRCSIYDSTAGGIPGYEQVYTEVSGVDTTYSWIEFNVPNYKVLASDPVGGDYNLVWLMFTQNKMDWDNYYVIKTATTSTYTPFGISSSDGGQGNMYQTDSGTGFLLTSGTWGLADNWSIPWSQIYTKMYLSDRWNTEGLWNSWDHIYTTSGTPALISSNINDIYIYEGASDYSTNQNWNKIYLATDSGVQIIDERRTDITLSKSTLIGLEGALGYDRALIKGSTYNSTAVWNLEEEGNFYVGTNDGYEGGAFNAMNFTPPIYLQDFLTTDLGGGYVPDLTLYSNNINDIEIIYLSGLRSLTV